MNRALKILIFNIFFFLSPFMSLAQFNLWAWMAGDNTPNGAANYGTQGVAAATNKPDAFYEGGGEWVDLQGNFWHFGGGVGNGGSSTLWKFDPVTNLWTWVKGPTIINQNGIYGVKGIPAAANNPGARYFGSLTWVDNVGNLWMFGGYGYNAIGLTGFLNDLWKYDIGSNMWTWMGGSNNLVDQNGVYGTKGTAAAGNWPGGRCETDAAWTDAAGNFWIFGGDGFAASNTVNAKLNDLWKYDPGTNQWTWMHGSNAVNQPAVYGTQGTAAAANTPSGRFQWASWKDLNGNFWIFGGNTQAGFNNDLWKYDPNTNMWAWMKGPNAPNQSGSYGTQCVTAASNNPPFTSENRARVSDDCGNFWMFGSMSHNDLWRYSHATNNWTWVSGSNLMGQTSVFGTKGVAAAGNVPGEHEGGFAFRRPNVNELWFLGGQINGAVVNEFWKFTPDKPTAVFNFNPNNACTGSNVNFTNSSTPGCNEIKSYLWNFNDPASGAANISTVANPVHVFNAAGSYSVKLVVTNCTGSKDSVTNVVTVITCVSLPTVSVAGGSVCSGSCTAISATVSGGSSPYTYAWSPNIGATAGPHTVCPTATTIYTLTVTDNNNNSVTGTAIVTVFNCGTQPTVTATGGEICEGGCKIIKAEVAGGMEPFKYTWLPGPGFDVGAKTVCPLVTTIYTIIVTDAQNRTTIDTAIVIVKPAPAVQMSVGKTKGCATFCTDFELKNNPAEINTFLWSFGKDSLKDIPKINWCYSIAGNYTTNVAVTFTNGCVRTAQVGIEVYPKPKADFTYFPLKPTVTESEVKFTDASYGANIIKWDWYFMDLPKPYSNLQNPSYVYNDAGTYAVALKVTSSYGCTDTLVRILVVSDDYVIYVPNAFTPNGDGLNDIFSPKGYGITHYELRIFNRWGEELLFTNDFAKGWDGMYKDKLSEEGEYVWKINLTNTEGKTKKLAGNVMLLK